MEIGQQIAAERNRKGITQQQLAESTKLTVRTIQRIENGHSLPRAFTVMAIADALGTSFQDLQPKEQQHSAMDEIPAADDQRFFLQMLTLSCFAYFIIPIVHFLIPMYIFKKAGIKDQPTVNASREIIRTQVIWTIATNLLMLLTLAFNFISAIYFRKVLIINFLLPIFVMFAINALLIIRDLIRISRPLR